MRILPILLLIFVAFDAGADVPCTLAAESTLFAAVHDPEHSSEDDWRAASRALYRFMRECPRGPADAESRERFFEFVRQDFSLDYAKLAEIWRGRGQALTDGGWESIEYGRQDLLAYLDMIVDPARDVRFAPVVLRYGNGPAIAALGHTVKKDVLELARTRPVEAATAIGRWIRVDEQGFSAAEKEELTTLLVTMLPDPTAVAPGAVHLRANAVLEALSAAHDPRIAATLRTWAAAHEKHLGYENTLARAARKSAESITASGGRTAQ
jgi:hypothetical protein